MALAIALFGGAGCGGPATGPDPSAIGDASKPVVPERTADLTVPEIPERTADLTGAADAPELFQPAAPETVYIERDTEPETVFVTKPETVKVSAAEDDRSPAAAPGSLASPDSTNRLVVDLEEGREGALHSQTLGDLVAAEAALDRLNGKEVAPEVRDQVDLVVELIASSRQALASDVSSAAVLAGKARLLAEEVSPE
ncbi:MAG: hypothetical protein KC591_11105 [Gemmatimonadetes bacterium]|nr:hypothetical protein [Gemmatimonadota bacterium]